MEKTDFTSTLELGRQELLIWIGEWGSRADFEPKPVGGWMVRLFNGLERNGAELTLGCPGISFTTGRCPGKCLAHCRLSVFVDSQSQGRQAFELLKRLSVDFQRTSNSDGTWGWQVTGRWAAVTKLQSKKRAPNLYIYI